MPNAVNRRTLWLAGLLVVAVIAGLVAWTGGDDAAPPAPTRPAGRPGGPEAQAPPVDVHLEALARARGGPADLGRNPFRFRAAAPNGGDAPVRRLPNVPDDQVDAPPAPMKPVGPPPPPPIALKFIGIVEKADGTRIAVLSDGKRPISGTEGEEIEGRYRILKIGNESLEIAYLDGRGRQTIRLTGQ